MPRFAPRVIAGGTTTNFLRPSQKTNVASAIIAAGTPKATRGP